MHTMLYVILNKYPQSAVCKAKEKAEPERNLRFRFSLVVPAAGVEPAPCRQDRILSPARLPIPSRRQTAISIIQNSSRKVNNF